jgi:citrate synthase
MTDQPDGSLEGVIVAQTRIAHVDGRRGIALIRGYLLPALAARGSYDDAAFLVLRGEMPTPDERARFLALLKEAAPLDRDTRAAVEAIAAGRPHADALAAALALAEDAQARECTDPFERCVRVLARVPSVCAAVTGVPDPPAEWSYAHRALAALGAKRDDAPAIAALETLLCLESEHGLSASTFACRVAASSGANAGPCLAAAAATLSGPRHGGATAQALGLLREASAAGDLAAFMRARFDARARLPGFGHRIYKVADPRVPPMRAAMHHMGNVPMLAIAEGLEQHGAPLYGSKGVHANIDLFGAALLDGLGVSPAAYVAAFALGIACGWLAHWAEQRETGRLIRPDSSYIGPAQRDLP